MKRYRFALATALRARRAQEDLARQRLAAANRRVLSARMALEFAVKQREAACSIDGPVESVTFRAAQAVQDRMAGRVEMARRVVADAQVAAATCYAGWVEAAQAVASLERLDERRLAEWRAEVLREEAAAVDDVVVYRWIAGSAGSEAAP